MADPAFALAERLDRQAAIIASLFCSGSAKRSAVFGKEHGSICQRPANDGIGAQAGGDRMIEIIDERPPRIVCRNQLLKFETG